MKAVLNFILMKFRLNYHDGNVGQLYILLNLVQTNELMLIPVVENSFFNQRLALPVTK